MQKKQGLRPASFIPCVLPYGFRFSAVPLGSLGKCLPVLRRIGIRPTRLPPAPLSPSSFASLMPAVRARAEPKPLPSLIMPNARLCAEARHRGKRLRGCRAFRRKAKTSMPFTRPLYVPSFLKKLPQTFGLRTEFALQTRSVGGKHPQAAEGRKLIYRVLSRNCRKPSACVPGLLCKLAVQG